MAEKTAENKKIEMTELAGKSHMQEEAVRCAQDYIEKNFRNTLCLDEIAEHTGYSKYHLNRIFKEQMGSTMFKYIQQCRLEQAAEELALTDKPVVEIALDAGYGSQQAFTLAFRQVYSLAPQQYRIRRRYVMKMMAGMYKLSCRRLAV